MSVRGEKLISVVVTAFNVGKYLNRCMESVCGQSYRNIEILLVYTKSEDSTKEICDEAAEKDQRVKLLLCPEVGVSKARNIALQHAKGEYVAFVDGDDYVEQGFLELLHQNIQGREISVCGFDRIKREEKHVELLGEDVAYEREGLVTEILCNNTIGGYLWNKLFRTDIIKNNGLMFRTDLSIGEDMVFIAEYMKSVKVGYYSNEICYHYCFNENSALQKMYTTGVFEEGKLSNMKASRYIEQSLEEDSHAVKEAISYRMVRTGMWTLFNMLKCDHYDEQILKNIQDGMCGNTLIYCRNSRAKGLEKAAAVMVRVWPKGFWRAASFFIKVAPEEIVDKYVK